MNTKMGRIGATVTVAALAVGGLQVVASAPAAAVAGLVRVVGPSTPNNDQVDKSISAQCPATSPRIVGGGIEINDGGQRRVFARFMQPTKIANGQDFYSVGATAPTGFVGTYSLRAIAVCASNAGVPGHEVVPGTATTPSSSTSQDTIELCSSTAKRVIGFGGGVIGGGREVGLQTVRSTGPRDGARAYAREDSSFGGQWQVLVFAICMTTTDTRPPSGAPIPGAVASTLCSDSPNTFVHGPGGGAWDGSGWINQIVPSANLKQNTVVITPGSTAAFTSTICIP
jgi:hypothetical protein